jgi:hypothetical protein
MSAVNWNYEKGDIMMKKLLAGTMSLVLALSLSLFGSSLAFADPEPTPAAYEIVDETGPDSDIDDTLVGSNLLRELTVPTNYWNLTGNNYTANLQLVGSANLYTNYYFHPNSVGVFRVSYSVLAVGGTGNMTVGVYDKGNNSVVATYTVTSISTSTTAQAQVVFTGLSTSGNYAIFFRSATSGVTFAGTATIKHI